MSPKNICSVSYAMFSITQFEFPHFDFDFTCLSLLSAHCSFCIFPSVSPDLASSGKYIRPVRL